VYRGGGGGSFQPTTGNVVAAIKRSFTSMRRGGREEWDIGRSEGGEKNLARGRENSFSRGEGGSNLPSWKGSHGNFEKGLSLKEGESYFQRERCARVGELGKKIRYRRKKEQNLGHSLSSMEGGKNCLRSGLGGAGVRSPKKRGPPKLL